jgi:hypothetical protein
VKFRVWAGIGATFCFGYNLKFSLSISNKTKKADTINF